MVRCFIGFILPEEIKDKVVVIEKRMFDLRMECKMVERNNLHLCLSFLGDVDGKDVGGITNNLDEVCSKHKKLVFDLPSIRFIPNENRIRVIGLDCASKDLESLRKDIESVVGGDSKPLHITLCRVKKMEDRENVVNNLKSMCIDVGKVEMSSIQLIKSELGGPSAIYDILYESRLSTV